MRRAGRAPVADGTSAFHDSTGLDPERSVPPTAHVLDLTKAIAEAISRGIDVTSVLIEYGALVSSYKEL